MRIGDQVEVLVRFDHSWAAGFVLDALEPDGCRVRRITDGALLPVVLPLEDVREVGASV